MVYAEGHMTALSLAVAGQPSLALSLSIYMPVLRSLEMQRSLAMTSLPIRRICDRSMEKVFVHLAMAPCGRVKLEPRAYYVRVLEVRLSLVLIVENACR